MGHYLSQAAQRSYIRRSSDDGSRANQNENGDIYHITDESEKLSCWLDTHIFRHLVNCCLVILYNMLAPKKSESLSLV